MFPIQEAEQLNPSDIILTEGDESLERLWTTINELFNLPRRYGTPDDVEAFLIHHAEEAGCEYKIDSVGNVLIMLPASTPDLATKPGVLYHANADLVVPELIKPYDQPVDPYVVRSKGKHWAIANETSMAAKDTVATGVLLSLFNRKNQLATSEILHGPIAFLFTFGQDTDLPSIQNIGFEEELQNYHFLVDVGTKTGGEITIGNPATFDSTVTFKPKMTDVQDLKFITITLDNILGGDARENISDRRFNAVRTMAYVLQEVDANLGGEWINLVSIDGGDDPDAIPNKVTATIGLRGSGEIYELLQQIRLGLKDFVKTKGDEKLTIDVEHIRPPVDTAMSHHSTETLLKLIRELPNGVSKSPQIEGLEKSKRDFNSNNIYKIYTDRQNYVQISMRSRVTTSTNQTDVLDTLRSIAQKYNADTELESAKAGWKPDTRAIINLVCQRSFEYGGNTTPPLEYTHADLEVYDLLSAWPWMQAVSVGSTIIGAGKTEMLDIADTNRLYRSLLNISWRVALLEEERKQ